MNVIGLLTRGYLAPKSVAAGPGPQIVGATTESPDLNASLQPTPTPSVLTGSQPRPTIRSGRERG